MQLHARKISTGAWVSMCADKHGQGELQRAFEAK